MNSFEIQVKNQQIIIEASISYKPISAKSPISMLNAKMLLDTGSVHTILDTSFLDRLGYSAGFYQKSQNKTPLYTFGGSIQTYKFKLPVFEVVGIQLKNFEVLCYDFPLSHIAYNGIIGMDFLHKIHFCLDMPNQEIQIH